MFRRSCWLGALCLVLAAMLPTYVLGSQVLSSPPSLPVFETLSIPASPILYPPSPPILAFISVPITDRVQKLTLWADNTKKVVSHSFNKPCFIYSRLAMRAYRAISASLSRPSLPPSATRTLGGSLSPTRTRTTTTHHPAFPKPAYARPRGRSCTSHRPLKPSKPTPKSSGLQSQRGYTTVFVPGAARYLRILYASIVRAARFPASLVEEFHLLDTAERVGAIFILIFLIIVIFFEVRKVHYRYNLIIEGYQFSSKIGEWTRPWTSDYIYSERDLSEWAIWDAIDRDIQTIRMEYGRVPGFSLKLRVTRERRVRDWYITIFGMRSVEVLQDGCHGSDVFETEDEFMLAAPDLDCDLELPNQEWDELVQDWLCGDPPSPPSTPLQTPSLPQDVVLPPVRVVDPEDPEYEGGREDML